MTVSTEPELDVIQKSLNSQIKEIETIAKFNQEKKVELKDLI